MRPQREQVVQIPAGDVHLHGVLHHGDDNVGWGLVLADPFAEEKKCAHRSLVETARTLATDEISCLRFDYRGCGDSPGSFEEFDIRSWIQDTTDAALFLRSKLHGARVGLLGLRLGASIGMLAAERHDIFDFVILWEPMVNGREYLKMNLRRSLIKAMLTDSASFDAESISEEHVRADTVDFDGYPLTQRLREQIEDINMDDDLPHFTGPALILHLGPREQVPAELQTLADGMAHARAEAVRQEPFWQRIGLTDPSPAVEATELWLAELQAEAAAEGVQS